jgi:hypothetical protein
MKCYHWCRAGGGVGHEWDHYCLGTEQIDPYRLYCPEHGAEIAAQIMTGQFDDPTRAREQGRQEILGATPEEIPEAMEASLEKESPGNVGDEQEGRQELLEVTPIKSATREVWTWQDKGRDTLFEDAPLSRYMGCASALARETVDY